MLLRHSETSVRKSVHNTQKYTDTVTAFYLSFLSQTMTSLTYIE